MNVLGIDIGGTHLTCALVNTDNGSYSTSPPVRRPVNSSGDADPIFDCWCNAIRETVDVLSLSAIGIAMPGPFDYENGVSRIKGLCKYESIYGMNVKNALRPRLGVPDDFHIVMDNDCNTFALGEHLAGAARNGHRIIGITLGTGLGSGFVAGGKIIYDGKGVPYDASLNAVPYRGKTAEDFISSRGLRKIYTEKGGNANYEVLQIAQAAKAGEELGITVFNELGRMIAEVLTPWLKEFEADTLVIGGSIAGSYALFEESLTDYLDPSIKVFPAELPATAGLIGAATLAKRSLTP